MRPPVSDQTNQSELSAGWHILVFATLATVLTGPGQTIGVSVFVDYLEVDVDLNLSRTEITSAYLVGTLLGATAMPLIGRLIDRRGVQLSQIVVGALFGSALLYMSFVNGLIMLAAGFIGIRMMGQGSLSMISTVTVQLRFVKQRGLAIGIFAMAGGALMALVPIALKALIDASDWRTAWQITAAIIWATVIPLGAFGLRTMPRAANQNVLDDSPPLVGVTRSEAVRTRSFWIIAVVATVSSMLSTAFNFHQIDLLRDAGLTSTEAASMFLPQILGSTVASFLVGAGAHRTGVRYLPVAPMMLLLGVHLLGASLDRGPIVFLYAVLLGSMGGAVRSATAILMPAWFGTAHIGSIQGVMTLAVVAGSALGPLTLTLTEERLGGYPAAFTALAIVPLAAIAFAATAPSPPQNQEQ